MNAAVLCLDPVSRSCQMTLGYAGLICGMRLPSTPSPFRPNAAFESMADFIKNHNASPGLTTRVRLPYQA
jgi:hypothetical protein